MIKLPLAQYPTCTFSPLLKAIKPLCISLLLPRSDEKLRSAFQGSIHELFSFITGGGMRKKLYNPPPHICQRFW